MDKTKNFYISASVAFVSYLLLIFLFFLYLSSNNVKQIDSFSKNTVLKLDIILQETKVDDIKHFKKIKINVKDSKISKRIVKKTASVSAKQKSNLKSLFAKVKTKSRVIKKKVVSNVVKSSTTSRFKSKFEKQSQTNNKSLSKLVDSKKSALVDLKTGDAKNEKDPYISKIYEILYKRWQPLLIVDGLSTKVKIIINKSGKFSYRVLQYSGDNSFDNQLVLFLERQQGEQFPLPSSSKIEIEVIFTAGG